MPTYEFLVKVTTDSAVKDRGRLAIHIQLAVNAMDLPASEHAEITKVIVTRNN